MNIDFGQILSNVLKGELPITDKIKIMKFDWKVNGIRNRCIATKRYAIADRIKEKYAENLRRVDNDFKNVVSAFYLSLYSRN